MTLETSLMDLEDLSRQYSPADPEALHAISTARAIKNEQALLDLAALAADLSVDDIINLGREPDVDHIDLGSLVNSYGLSSDKEIEDFVVILREMSGESDVLGFDPLILAAIVREYTRDLQDSLQHMQGLDWNPSDLTFTGHLGNIKGQYFQELVLDRLNNGEALGELSLQAGQKVELADKVGQPDQPGFDLSVINSDGSIDEEVSLKATVYNKDVNQALRDHPDIRVATPTEHKHSAEEVLQTNIRNSELESDMADWVTVLNETPAANLRVDISNSAVGANVRNQVEELTEDTLTNALDNTVEIALDAIPFASGVIVIASEGKAVLMGAAQLDDAMKRGAKRLGKTLPFTTAGAILMAASVPGVAVTPALLASRIWAARLGNRATIGDIAKQHADTLSALRY